MLKPCFSLSQEKKLSHSDSTVSSAIVDKIIFILVNNHKWSWKNNIYISDSINIRLDTYYILYTFLIFTVKRLRNFIYVYT